MSETPTPQDPKLNPTPADPTPPATPLATSPDAADVEKNKTSAMLSYIFILWLVPMLTAKDSPFAKFHCNQGILLTMVGFVGAIGITILHFVISYIPFLGGCMNCTLAIGFFLGMVALMIMGILNALGGKMKTLPMFPAVTFVK